MVKIPPAAVNLKPLTKSPPEQKSVHQDKMHQLSPHALTPTEATSSQGRPLVHFMPKKESEQNIPQSQFKSLWSPRDNTRDNDQSLRGRYHVFHESRSDVSDLAQFLAYHDLLSVGLTEFSDKPENYWGWKCTFSSAIKDLNLKPSKELNLLIKWLG